MSLAEYSRQKAKEDFRTPNASRSHRDLQIHFLDISELGDAKRLECESPLSLSVENTSARLYDAKKAELAQNI